MSGFLDLEPLTHSYVARMVGKATHKQVGDHCFGGPKGHKNDEIAILFFWINERSDNYKYAFLETNLSSW